MLILHRVIFMRNNPGFKYLSIMLILLYLAAPATAYAREQTLNISPDKDTYLREELPDSKYGSQTQISIGNYTINRRFNGLLEFTLPPAPDTDAIIVNIKLNLYYYGQSTSGSDQVDARELSDDFSENNATWYEKDTGLNWSISGALPPLSSSSNIIDSVTVDATRPTWKTFVLKDDAMSGVNWTWLTKGSILLMASGKTGKDLNYRFVSREATSSDPFVNSSQYKPFLEITYGNDSAPPVISNVTTNDTSFIILSNLISWKTDENATSLVKYGTSSGNYAYQKSDTGKKVNHSIELVGLKANTTYYFVLNSTDIFGNSGHSLEFNFTTSGNKSDHPFLIFTNITGTPGYKYSTISPWSSWKSTIMSIANSSLSKNFSDPTWRMSYQSEDAMYLGLAYQMTKNTTYAEKTKIALLNTSEDSVPYGIDKSTGAKFYSLAYDWVQPYLDSTSDGTIRDNLATLADLVYYDLNDGGTRRDSISFADYHGQAYPSMGIIGAALFDYNNPNNLPLTSTPLDWVKAGTDYLFVDDELHDVNNRSLFSFGFDDSGKHLNGAYKSYVISDFMWWFNIYSNFTNTNFFEVYPVPKRAFTSEIWESMPDHYHNNFITSGNTKWIYHKGIIGLLDSDNRSYVLKHIDSIENSNLLPYSKTSSSADAELLYITYENYSSVQRKNPSWTSHLNSNSIYQIFRGNWNNDSDWLSLITWNVETGSNRDMQHHDQMSFEYYSKGDLLLADAGENKYVIDTYYGEYEVHHNTIAIEDPRDPFSSSTWADSTARGIYKGGAVSLKTPIHMENLVQTSWMELMSIKAAIRDLLNSISSERKTLSSSIQYDREIIYPDKEYFIVMDRLEGTETWRYRNIFRLTSLNITPTSDENHDKIYDEPEAGNVNGTLTLGGIPYNWLSIPYKNETLTGINTSSIKWNTTNPYGTNVSLHLFSVPSAEIIVTKHVGRIAGYDSKSEVFNPIVYFRTENTTDLYRITVLLSKYDTEEEKIPSEVQVTGTGNAVKVTSPAYEDYVYSGKGDSSFASFTTDADTLYLRKTSRPSKYTLLNGSYLNYSGVPLINLSGKADYFTLKEEQNETTFKIKGSGIVTITLHQKDPTAAYQVKRDGFLYTNWMMNAAKIIITTDLSEHEFEVISNSTPDITPPSGVTGLMNVTYAPYFINWTWTDPSDTDFDHVEIYLDGVFRTNVAPGIGYYNATGLSPGTSYIIGTKTADASGNVNATPVTHSALTSPLPDTTPPSGVTGLMNATYAPYHINWTWTDPSDTDFDHVEIYLDGVFRTNVPARIGYYNATGLIPASLYTIGIKTVDVSGNTNYTLATHTAGTAKNISIILATYNISGRITYVNQTQLAGADVSLFHQNGTPSGLSTTSGPDGKFQFINIQSGLYYVSITKPGHEPNSSSMFNVTSDITVGTQQLTLYDLDLNGRINILDLSYIGRHFGEKVIQPSPFYDVNGDGIINMADMEIIGKHFGERY